MGRKKGKLSRTKKILIRVNKFEKSDTKRMSKEIGLNESEFLRMLIRDYKQGVTTADRVVIIINKRFKLKKGGTNGAYKINKRTA